MSGAGSHRTTARCHLSLIFAAAFATSCVGGQDPDAVGRTQQPVGSGIVDSTNVMAFVGALYDGSGLFCSGFLATRRYVVSANHCLDGARQSSDLRVVFAPSAIGVGDSDPRLIVHSLAASGPAFLRTPQIEETHASDWGRDVAVLRLDTRVPPSVAPFAVRPAGLTTPGCASEFNGLVAGYGPRESNFFGAGGVDEQRSFARSGGWHRRTHGAGTQTFANDFFPLDFSGPHPSDSGGPLFDTAALDRVCGVAFGNNAGFDLLLGGVTVRSQYAALDHPDNVAFLRDIIMDKRGNFIGEVPPVNDPDNDAVDSSEDNCPLHANPDQLDSDGDGRGDVCDNCRFVRNPDQSNSNLAAEEKEFGVPSDVGRTNDYLSSNWPGDRCDRRPLTVALPTGGDYRPARNPRSIACTERAGLFCTPLNPDHVDGVCEVSENNLLVANEFVSTSITEVTTDGRPLNGLTRVLACSCVLGEAKEECDARCDRRNVANPNATWRMASIANPDTGSSRNFLEPVIGRTPYIRSLHALLDDNGSPAYSENWGWAYWLDFASVLPPPRATGDVSEVVLEALMWTWVKNYAAAGTFGGAPASPPAATSKSNACGRS